MSNLIAVLFEVEGFSVIKTGSNIELKMSLDKFSEPFSHDVSFKTLCSTEVTMAHLEKDIREFEMLYNFPNGLFDIYLASKNIKNTVLTRVNHRLV